MSCKENFLIKEEDFDPKEQRFWQGTMSTNNGELGAQIIYKGENHSLKASDTVSLKIE